MLNGLDLFSGIGGISLALSSWVRPVLYCENDKYAQAVLLSRMADKSLRDAPIWDDVRTLHGDLVPPIDIIYGGFPCQDISIAGIGRGLDGERSGLVKEIFRLADETKPSFIFLENVPAIRTRGANIIVQKLAAIGYDCRWTTVSAGEVGAPHKRERWFLLAYAKSARLEIGGDWGGVEEAVSLPSGSFSSAFWNDNAFYSSRISDGVLPRSQRLKALGNAVVPFQAKEAFERLVGLK